MLEQAAEDWLTGRLAANRTLARRHEVAGSPWLPATLARRLAGSRDLSLLFRLAGNPAVGADVITSLAACPRSVRVRNQARTHPACPWPVVIADPDFPAENSPHCPPEILARLAEPRMRRLPEAVLMHPNLPAAAIDDLIERIDRSGAATLLENPAVTHPQALRVMARLDWSPLPWRWSGNPNADPDWLAAQTDLHWGSIDQSRIAHIARNPNTPAGTLRRILTGHAHYDYVIGNPNCPTDLLTELSDPGSGLHERLRHAPRWFADLLRAAATHPNSTRSVLTYLDARAVPHTPDRLAFTARWANSGDQARVLLHLLPDWTGTLDDLLDVAKTVATTAG